MSFPKYPKYKDSGVEWLGEVPEHWEVIQLKRIADVNTGVAKGKDLSGRETISVPYLRVANVQDGYLDLDFVATIEIPACELERYMLKPGDVLMNEGGDFDKLGRGYIWEAQIDPCITQNHVFAVRPRRVHSAWLNAVTGSSYGQFYFMTRSKQSTNLASISSTNLMELPVVLPPRPEQLLIAMFVDRETSKIDELVAEQRRLIELLKEKRQAVISHAVTKGLNPNVPLRDSGIEWLGEVPEHWDVVALKRGITKIGQGWSPQCESDVAAEGEWGVVKVGCCNRFNMVETEQKKLPAEITPMIEYEIQDGDILMSRGNTLDLVGMATMATNVRPRLLLSDLVYRFRAVENQFDAAFLVHSLRSKNVRTQVECEAVGSSATMKKVSQEVVRNFFVCKPSVLEQQEIANHLAAMSAEFDNLEGEATRGIELLQERRTALISAAVTGKIDVRSFATQIPEVA